MHACTGGSLGPEAALLALCGATTSWVAKNVLGFRGHRLRNMTLLGMTAGLAAFFGVALGGAPCCCRAACPVHCYDRDKHAAISCKRNSCVWGETCRQ